MDCQQGVSSNLCQWKENNRCSISSQLIIHRSQRPKKQGNLKILFKIDMKKAYDEVKWEFVEYMLKEWLVWYGRRDWQMYFFNASWLIQQSLAFALSSMRVVEGSKKATPKSHLLYIINGLHMYSSSSIT